MKQYITGTGAENRIKIVVTFDFFVSVNGKDLTMVDAGSFTYGGSR
jgi:hypothetical protein